MKSGVIKSFLYQQHFFVKHTKLSRTLNYLRCWELTQRKHLIDHRHDLHLELRGLDHHRLPVHRRTDANGVCISHSFNKIPLRYSALPLGMIGAGLLSWQRRSRWSWIMTHAKGLALTLPARGRG